MNNVHIPQCEEDSLLLVFVFCTVVFYCCTFYNVIECVLRNYYVSVMRMLKLETFITAKLACAFVAGGSEDAATYCYIVLSRLLAALSQLSPFTTAQSESSELLTQPACSLVQ